MNKIFTLVTVLAFSSFASAKSLNVSIEAGQLSNTVAEADKLETDSITITGSINSDDIKYLREMAGINYYGYTTGTGALKYLNLADANVVKGGEGYYEDPMAWGMGSPSSIEVDGILADNAFRYSPTLEEVVLPKSMTQLGEYSFASCPNLKKVTLGENVTRIRMSAFEGDNLSEVTVNAATAPTLSDSGAPFSSSTLSNATLVKPAGSDYSAWKFSNVYDGVTLTEAGTISSLIPADAKSTIQNLKVTGPINGTDIKYLREMAGLDVYGAASGTGSLKNLDLSDADVVKGGDNYYKDYYYDWGMGDASTIEVDNILGSNAFANSPTLESVVLPESLTQIGEYAFSNCKNLKTVTIGKNVTRIRMEAFSGSTNIENVISEAVVAPTLSDSGAPFDNATKQKAQLVVPAGSDYSSWGFGNVVTNGVSRINAKASDAEVVGIYTLDGQQIPSAQKGINIVKYTDGTTRKVLVK